MTTAFQPTAFQNNAFQIDTIQSFAYIASGGIVFSGAASVTTNRAIKSLIVSPSGGLIFSGVSSEIRSRTSVAIGGILFGGNANIILTPDPSIIGHFFKRCRRPRFRTHNP